MPVSLEDTSAQYAAGSLPGLPPQVISAQEPGGPLVGSSDLGYQPRGEKT